MRNLPSLMLDKVSSNDVSLAFLADLAFETEVFYVWTGVGDLVCNGHIYKGVGSFGDMGDIVEDVQTKADGTTISLSGLDPAALNDCLHEIQLGAPVTLWLALFQDGAILSVYQIFVGTVDQPVIAVAPDTMTIALKLENKLSNHGRATNRRYTASDQRYYYPDDIGFAWVESLNDIALRWG